MWDVGVHEAPNSRCDGDAVRGWAKFNGQFWISGALGVDGCRALGVAKEEFWYMEGAEWVGKGEALVEEERDWQDTGTWVSLNPGEGVAVG